MEAMKPSYPPVPVAPGPPIVGHLPELRKNRVAFLERLRREFGNTVAFRAGPVRAVLLAEPADVRAALVERAYDFHKAPTYRFLKVMLGEGLLTSEGDLHRGQRRLLAPYFTPRRIRTFADAIVACAEDTRWNEGQVVDVVEAMSALTLVAANRSLFGDDIDTEAPGLSDSFLAFNRWVVEEAYRSIHLPVWLPLPRHAPLRKARRVVETEIGELIRRRRGREVPGEDMLSALMGATFEEGGHMSDEQLRDEIFTLMFAGHETTALALAWTFYLLARHPDERLRLEREVDEVLGGRPPTVDDIERLSFTHRVLLESLRLYPPAPVIGRQAQRDVELATCSVRRGTVVTCSIFSIHHRPDLHPEPDAFRPERFASNQPPSDGTYMPFGLGPRICIGNHFAMMEAQLLLASLVQRYRLDLVDDAPVAMTPLVTLHPARPVMARVTPRVR